jgi:acetyl esterase/lipase
MFDRLRAPRPANDIDIDMIGPISVRTYKPASGVTAPSPGLLWIHGGGYVMGTAAVDDAICRHFAHELGIIVASVDYRLAPENPFPTPLHDCYHALTWFADRTATRTDIDEPHIRCWNNAANRFGWQSYLCAAPGSVGINPLAAPARYEDLSGLPPAWIGVGSLDLFYEEDIAYANRLTAAGVGCDRLVIDGAFHGFDLARPHAGISQRFRAAQIKALADALK